MQAARMRTPQVMHLSWHGQRSYTHPPPLQSCWPRRQSKTGPHPARHNEKMGKHSTPVANTSMVEIRRAAAAAVTAWQTPQAGHSGAPSFLRSSWASTWQRSGRAGHCQLPAALPTHLEQRRVLRGPPLKGHKQGVAVHHTKLGGLHLRRIKGKQWRKALRRLAAGQHWCRVNCSAAQACSLDERQPALTGAPSSPPRQLA